MDSTRLVCKLGFALGSSAANTGDATLVVLSELCPRAGLITVDDDFRRCRRFRHPTIPLVIPDRA